MQARKGLLESLTFLPNWLMYPIGVFCMTIVEPLKGNYFRYREFYNFLEKSQWWPREELEEYQKERLGVLLGYVYKNVPYYEEVLRKNRLTPSDFALVDDLKKLPILTKEDVTNNLDKLISKKVKKKHLKLAYTSGSTGKPVFFYLDTKDRFINWVFMNWRCKLADIRISDKNIRFWSRPFIERNLKNICLYEPYYLRLSLSTVPTAQHRLEEYLKLIKEFKPVFVVGSPSFLYRLACYAQDTGNVTVSFPVLFSNYENLYPFQRNLIQNQFHCEVFNIYSFEENLIYATECNKHEGMHIDIRKGIMEIVGENGEVIDNMRPGRIICTGLHNYAMPLIRYDTGDVGSISNRQCSCGRGLPLLKSLDGRTSEVIKYNGKSIHPATLSVILERFRNIKECQFIQESEDRIKINIIKRETYLSKDTEELAKALKRIINEGLKIEINFVDDIPRTKFGKFQFVINRLTQYK